MKSALSIVFVCLAFVSCGQRSATVPPADIATKKTSKHVNIPGTRVFMIPPSGFRLSATLAAFEKGDQGQLQVSDLIGGNFYTNAATFSKEKFEGKGIKVLEYKTFRVNGFPAKMALIQGPDQTNIYNLVFGDSTFSTMIMGVYSDHDKQTGEAIWQAIQSIYYDKAFSVNPFANAPFKLDDSRSIFKFAQFSASIYMYSIGGIKKKSYDNEPFFMAFAAPSDGSSLRSTADDMAETIKNGSIKNVSEAPVNGLPSYRREVYGELKGKPAVLYQHLVRMGDNFIIMQGLADDDAEKYIAEFQKLSSTIRQN